MEKTFLAWKVNASDLQSDNPGSVLGPSPDDQPVHPNEVGRLAAISRQWVTAVEDCDGKACGSKMAGVRRVMLEAPTSSRWFRAACTAP